MSSIRILEGVMIILFVLIVNIVVAFVETGAASSSEFADCSEESLEDCDNVGKTSFFSALADVSFTGFDGAPTVVNVLWLTIMGLLLSTAILLIVVGFIPTTSA